MSRPTSGPEHVTAIASGSSRATTSASTPSVSTIRATSARASPAWPLSSVAALGCGRRLRGLGRQMRDHAGRLVADTEDPALAFGDDLELHRGLVEPGIPPLELAQRRPLRLANRLARSPRL